MSHTLLAFTLIGLAVDLLRISVLAWIGGRSRPPYLRWWVAACVVQLLGHIFVLPAVLGQPSGPLFAFAGLSMIASAGLFLRGAFGLVGRPWPRWWPVVAGIAAVAGGALPAVVPAPMAAIVPCAFLAGTYLAMAWGVGRSRLPDGLGKRLTAGALVVAGLHCLDFPVLGQVDWFVPYGLALEVVTAMALTVGFAVLHTDLSRAAEVEAELRSAELVNALGVGLYQADPSGRLLQVNPALVRLLGCADEAEARALTPFAQAGPGGVEVPWVRPDGRRLVLHVTALAAGGGQRGVVVDRTEASELEESLRRVQKLDAVGQLAGGVAHDLNNLLTVLEGAHGVLAAARLAPDERDAVDDAKEAATQAGHLTRRLLAFGRKSPPRLGPVDATAAVNRSIQLLERALPRHLLDQRTLYGPSWVLADAGQLEQVVVNLVLNARDAMPAGGPITLSVRPARRSGREGVEICVADRGVGIPSEDRDRIFDPFFTTRAERGGTGLGLATVRQIARQSGGEVEVESEVGNGSTFRVWLPASEAPAPATLVPLPDEPRAKPQRVLLAEDEPAVRRAVRRLLEEAGYAVQEAVNGAQVVRLHREGERFDVVLSDVHMPEVDGPEAAAIIRALAPQTCIVLMSGYLEPQRSPSVDAWLQKPFTRARLREALAEASRARHRPPT